MCICLTVGVVSSGVCPEIICVCMYVCVQVVSCVLYVCVALSYFISPNITRGLKLNFAAKSGILGSLILLCRLLYEKKY